MNKIIIEEASIENIIKLENNNCYYINYVSKDIAFNCDVKSNVIVNIFNTVSSNYIFNILNDANVEINIFDSSENIKRNIQINMNGENSSVKLNLSAISISENDYIINIYHNSKKTYSKTNIHGLAIDNNKIFIKNSGHIKRGSSKSTLNQDNKIIIMDDNNCKIEPNLFIDEYDVEASHGAYIGKFDDEELFYLNSRGINEKDSYSLLIEGFLIGNMNINTDDKEYLKEIINKYWR